MRKSQEISRSFLLMDSRSGVLLFRQARSNRMESQKASAVSRTPKTIFMPRLKIFNLHIHETLIFVGYMIE
jgi:hypothetical protein